VPVGAASSELTIASKSQVMFAGESDYILYLTSSAQNSITTISSAVVSSSSTSIVNPASQTGGGLLWDINMTPKTLIPNSNVQNNTDMQKAKQIIESVTYSSAP
jgi:hypothetical protein